ncbi:MAG: hypothetical protein QOD06_242, partial [Candidatus Binatota bacterium]|nr:hypothetical protein [Candidatus Binatota bacterium]
MTASGGRRFAAAQHEYAERHLRRLYDISKLLTRFESIERTLPAILDIAADALPLRTGILVESVAARPRVTVWNVPAADRKEIADAKAKAMSAYAYFTEPVVRDLAAKTVLLAAAGSETGPDDHPFVTIPLVVPEHPAFGVLQMGLLQVGPSAHLDPLDVAFVNAVANQLAVAIDRQRAWERILEQEDIAREEAECRRIEADERRARAELAMKRYAILSESSEALSQFLEREETLTSLARLLVASMAEWCIIDLVRDDGTLHRARVFGADPTRAEIAGRLVGPLDRNVPEPTVMAITEGKAKLWSRVSDADLESFRRKDDPIASVRRLCPGSIIAVPLTIAKRTLGAIALISSEQGRYGEQDVTFAGELAHRAAIALDNADTYARAQHATRRREEVLAVVSHDLRNPVHTMLFGVEALLDLLDPADPAVKLVESLHRAADTMVRLTRDLLDFSSVESGRLSIDLEPAEANPIAREAVEAMKREAAAKSLSVSMELEADDVFIVCDRQRV